MWHFGMTGLFAVPRMLEGKPSMDNTTMKNKKNALMTGAIKWILGACMVLMGAQSAFALGCKGNVYFKPPTTWTTGAWTEACGTFTKLSAGENGWLTSPLAGVGGANCAAATSFWIGNSGSQYCDNTSSCVTKSAWDMANNQNRTKDLIDCPPDGKDLYISEDLTNPGTTRVSTDPPDAKYLYLLIPKEWEDWMSSIPMISMDGGVTGKEMKADPDRCGWYYYVWLDEEVSNNVVFFKDDDTERTDMIGLLGDAENNATPIPMNAVFAARPGTDAVFFVPSPDTREELGITCPDGFCTEDPQVDGTCEYKLAAVIYDTDASLHPAFSCYVKGGEGCQNGAQGISRDAAIAAVNACIGVTPGIVEEYLDPTVPQKQRKPKLSALGKTCFISDEFFNQMFMPTNGVNEVSCFDMPFARAKDGKWEFNSDDYKGPGMTVKGGFYPVEASTDESVLLAYPAQTPLLAARTKQVAESPVWVKSEYLDVMDPVEGVPLIDVYCSGPGWSGGVNCGGAPNSGAEKQLFNDGEFPAVWDWGSREVGYGWPTNSKRNQHYCFESHATFTWKPGLRFSFRGDDDIWVFIDNKLAVDLGGTHLAAPGYVDLDYFKGLSGGFERNTSYPIDIFFCDRRTTMSNVRIKTNMYIVQSSGIQAKPVKDPTNPSLLSYEICYNKTGDGSCASALTGGGEEISCCGEEFGKKEGCIGLNIEYFLVQGKVWNAEIARPLAGMSGVDLSNPVNPKFDQAAMAISPGRWSVFAIITEPTGSKTPAKLIKTFTKPGSLDVVSGDAQAVYIDETTGDIIASKTKNYKFISEAIGGASIPTEADLVPFYVSAVLKDGDALIMQPEDAVGQTYSLAIPAGMTVYRKGAGGALEVVTDKDEMTVGESGVDTLYAYVSLMSLSMPTQKFDISVAGSGHAVATITFYLPRMTFVKSDTSIEAVTGMLPVNPATGEVIADDSFDPEEDQIDVGSYTPFYLMALKPNGVNADGTTKYAPCETCNFSFTLGSNTSDRIDTKVGEPLQFVDGRATINIRSLKEYAYEMDSPATIEVVGDNPAMVATYYPAYFRNPPVPFPILVDIFDVKGATPSVELAVPAPYFNMNQEYLDGIADSVAIYYNRRIHQDSLPLSICVMWDSLTAEAIDPTALGIDNTSGETSKLCNVNIPRDPSWCTGLDGEKYCDPVITIGGQRFSNRVKTGGAGDLFSYAVYKNKKKNTEVKKYYSSSLVDRIAPIIISAVADSVKGGYASLQLTVSEPVMFVGDSARSYRNVDFFLSTSTDLVGDARFASATENSGTDIASVGGSTFEDTKDGYAIISMRYDKKKAYPDNGDAVRLGGDLAKIIWNDKADISSGDTLRGTADAAFNWNAPTGYKETTRLPSPWVEIQGNTGTSLSMTKFAHTGNAGDAKNPFSVSVYDARKSVLEIRMGEGGRPGHMVKSNMPGLLHDTTYSKLLENMSDVYFAYEVSYFTNLGAYVAGSSGKIYCDDAYNKGVQYFNGGKCTDDPSFYRMFVVSWNMLSDKNRTVGTGAYITKISSYVRLGEFGKKESFEETSVIGVKRSAKPNEEYLKATE